MRLARLLLLVLTQEVDQVRYSANSIKCMLIVCVVLAKKGLLLTLSIYSKVAVRT